MTSVLSNSFCYVLDMKAPVNRQENCDNIRMQLIKYKTKELKDLNIALKKAVLAISFS